jgi:hypothetical protein
MSGDVETKESHDISWWQPMLFAAMAGGLGWGIRGQYGHETGAMIAGVLVSLTLVFLLCPGVSSLQVVRAAAMGTIAMGIGGTMTYGVTLGLTQNAEVVGNFASLRWGLLGCAVKGSVWIGFAGLFLGLGLGGKRYRPLEMLSLGLGMIAMAILGAWLLNSPFDPGNGRLPAIHFSSIDHWAPDTKSRPRDEFWGGLWAALLFALVYCAWRKKDTLARNLGLWGILGGGLGFPLGQCLQSYHAWNPEVFKQGIWIKLDPHMNWWNNMETTFGFVMGATLGLGLWLNRRRIDLTPESEEKNVPVPLAWALFGFHAFMLVRMSFFGGWAGAIYDFGLILALIPFVCCIRGRIWPWFMVLPMTQIPIASKTVNELVFKKEIIAPLPGWIFYFIIPLALATGLAIWGLRNSKQGSSSKNFIALALLLSIITYTGLNFAIFDYAWPWADWTSRTPNGMVFFVFAGALIAMVVVHWNRSAADGAEDRETG